MFSKLLTAGLVSISLMTPIAQASETVIPEGYAEYRTNVILQWKPQTKTITVLFSTGCRSSSRASTLTENFSFSFDQNDRKIDITGSYIFKVEPREATRIVSADCMGSRSKKFEVEHVEYGPYRLTRNGEPLLSVDLVAQEQTFKFGGYNSAIPIKRPK